MGKLRKRLWKIGGLLASFALTLCAGNFFASRDKAFTTQMYGHDFLPFYTAGQIIRMGQGGKLYDAAFTRALEHQTCISAGLVIDNEYGAFLNPPFAALPAVGLAAFDYRTALLIWTAVLLAALVLSIFLLVQQLPPASDYRTWGLVPLLLFTAMPAWQAALHAQNSFISLLILSCCIVFWRGGRSFLAGVAAGMLLFKPQLAMVLIVVLTISRGWRAFAGAAATAAILLAINITALPASLGNYLHQLPVNLRAIQELPNYVWHRHVTFLAWWQILLQGHTGAGPTDLAYGLAGACMATVGFFLMRAAWAARHDADRTDILIAATVASAPLLMPYYMDYDLTLLTAAAVLCTTHAMRNGLHHTVVAAWIAFYIATEFNSMTAGVTRLIPDVPMLTFLSVTLIGQVRPRVAVVADAVPMPLPLRAAA